MFGMVPILKMINQSLLRTYEEKYFFSVLKIQFVTALDLIKYLNQIKITEITNYVRIYF